MTKLTSRQIIDKLNKRAQDMEKRAINPTGWAQRHVAAFSREISSSETGRHVVSMIKALGSYADSHFVRYDSTIGEDYVLGEGWSKIAQGIRTLLNGELGALDAGTLDGMISEIMLSNNVDPETGDLGYKVEESTK